MRPVPSSRPARAILAGLLLQLAAGLAGAAGLAPEDIFGLEVASDPQVAQVINRAGSPIEYLDAPDFQSYWDADLKVMVEAVKRIGKVE